MKFLVVLALVGFAAAQNANNNANNNRLQGQYVWDLLKPALTAGEVENLLASRDVSYPTYNEIPQTNFACGTRNGFYADVDTQCQVFHRCDLNGNQTSYLCVNTTVFNQITLICDAWYNVDCANSAQYESYANSRLYTDLPLFDTPPAGYLTPAQRAAEQAAGGQQQVQSAGVQSTQTSSRARNTGNSNSNTGNSNSNTGNGNSNRNIRTQASGNASARNLQTNSQNSQQVDQADQSTETQQ